MGFTKALLSGTVAKLMVVGQDPDSLARVIRESGGLWVQETFVEL